MRIAPILYLKLANYCRSNERLVWFIQNYVMFKHNGRNLTIVNVRVLEQREKHYHNRWAFKWSITIKTLDFKVPIQKEFGMKNVCNWNTYIFLSPKSSLTILFSFFHSVCLPLYLYPLNNNCRTCILECKLAFNLSTRALATFSDFQSDTS